MSKFSFPTFKSGIDKIRNNPQLVYTIAVALIITAAFAIMSERFIRIANDAQERLINVRIGSLQDAFVSFAEDYLYDPDYPLTYDSEYLNKKIREIVSTNETIVEFKVIERWEDPDFGPFSKFVIIASNNPQEVGQDDASAEFLYALSGTDPTHSFTMEIERDGERMFQTARAISGYGAPSAVIISTQTLSQADIAIEKSIANNMILLIGVLIFIMFLFLRHAKIIDYTVLYKKLKEVDTLKDDFISMASHELRTPLTIIRGYVEYIKDSPSLSEDAKGYAAKIDASAKELDSLVADILDVSRIEQGRMSFKLEKIDPTEIAESVASSLVAPATAKGIKISFDKKSLVSLPLILADKERLKQALVNVAGNAVKYTKVGEVIIKEYIEGNSLLFVITDTGIGMSSEEQKRLFEKFYRIRTKDTEEIRGTGLGLWITAKIIKEMGGSISVESIKGVGSHFIISFPILKNQ